MLTHFMHSSWLRGVILEEWYTSAQASTDFHKFSLFTNFYKSQILTNFLFFYKFLRVYSFPHISSTPCVHFSPILSLFLFLSPRESLSPSLILQTLPYHPKQKFISIQFSLFETPANKGETHTGWWLSYGTVRWNGILFLFYPMSEQFQEENSSSMYIEWHRKDSFLRFFSIYSFVVFKFRMLYQIHFFSLAI